MAFQRYYKFSFFEIFCKACQDCFLKIGLQLLKSWLKCGLSISPFTVTGAHAHWVGSTDTPSHAAKELKMRLRNTTELWQTFNTTRGERCNLHINMSSLA